MSGHSIVKFLGARALEEKRANIWGMHRFDSFDDFPEPLRDDGINIMMTPSRMMTGTAMSGHFIVKLVIRSRKAGEVLQRRGKTRVFPSP